jgi:hypothetical protein
MPSDPNGWPDEAREVVGRAMRQAQYKDRLLSSDWDSWQEAYWLDQANAALAALAPFVAAALAQARRDAMEEAAAMADGRATTNAARAYRGPDDYLVVVLRHLAAAVRAKAREAGDE